MNKQIEEMAFDLCFIDECKHLPREECNKTTCVHCQAEALYNAGYRKQKEVIKEFVKRVEKYLANCTFTMGQTNDIQYALKEAAEEMGGGE